MGKSTIPVFYTDASIGEVLLEHRVTLEKHLSFHHMDIEHTIPSAGNAGSVFIIDAPFFNMLPIKHDRGNIYFIVISQPNVSISKDVLLGGTMVDILPPKPKADHILLSLTRARGILTVLEENTILRKKIGSPEGDEDQIEQLSAIGIALSAERDIDVLLKMILTRTREITAADAGSLYLVEDADSGTPKLRFVLAQNDSRNVHLEEFIMNATRKSLAGYVALEGRTLNIEDTYKIPEDAPYRLDRKFDEETGYHTRSMLVVPMVTHTDEVIGVLQLINRKMDFSRQLTDEMDFQQFIIPFDERSEKLARSLGSQAAVALENTRLYEEIRALFEGLVHASVTAIESRDPATSGHSNRVAALTTALAKAVSDAENGPFANVRFTKDQLREIEYAGFLHDFGKIGVPENILVKEKKLQPHEFQAIRDRFHYLKKAIENRYSQQKFDVLVEKPLEDAIEDLEALEAELGKYMVKMDTYLEAITQANKPSLLAKDTASVIAEIGATAFTEDSGDITPFLTEEEVDLLAIPRGSLSEQERDEIENHVEYSYNFLSKIPWTKALKGVPEIAHQHHEKPDGSGYPRKLKARGLLLQSRMMAIADVFDALTAADRPYKPAVPVVKALTILDDMARKGHLDRELFELFVDAKVFESVK
jgi:HD-GYP domain-containing protein (c-di-GMP phosphodiesterase class II)